MKGIVMHKLFYTSIVIDELVQTSKSSYQ